MLMESVYPDEADCERRSMKIGKRGFALTVLKCSIIQWPTLFSKATDKVRAWSLVELACCLASSWAVC